MLRFLVRTIYASGLLLLAVGVLWVLLFASRLAGSEARNVPVADGIIVLTGGADRIQDGLLLLEAMKAKRLLISGVHQQVTMEELRKRWPGHDHAFTCCVDLDFRALNTFENAREGADWTRRSDFRSILLVTSNYHMLRARLEFEAAMPGIEIHAVPVIPDAQRFERWWLDPVLMRIIALESVKYAAARVRLALLALA